MLSTRRRPRRSRARAVGAAAAVCSLGAAGCEIGLKIKSDVGMGEAGRAAGGIIGGLVGGPGGAAIGQDVGYIIAAGAGAYAVKKHRDATRARADAAVTATRNAHAAHAP